MKHSPPTSRMTTKHQMFVLTTTWKTSMKPAHGVLTQQEFLRLRTIIFRFHAEMWESVNIYIYAYIWIDINVPPVISSIVKVIYWVCSRSNETAVPFHDRSSHLQSRWSKVIFFRLSPKMWIALIIVKWQGVLFAETKRWISKQLRYIKWLFL